MKTTELCLSCILVAMFHEPLSAGERSNDNVSRKAGVGYGFNFDDEADVTIDVNPTNPKNRVIAGHCPHCLVAACDEFRDKFHTFYTSDGGQSWHLVSIGDVGDVGDPPQGATQHDGLRGVSERSDPSVAFDADGTVYISYLAIRPGSFTIMVGRSVDGGMSYEFTEVGKAEIDDCLDGGKKCLVNDKPHLATGPDPQVPSRQNVYIAWTQAELEDGNPDIRIVASSSTNGGKDFSDPVIVNDASFTGTQSSANTFADPAVGPNGELYIAWYNVGGGAGGTVFVDVSLDRLDGFGIDRAVTTIDSRYNVGLKIPAQPGRGVSAAPNIDADRSDGPNNGRLYIAYTDLGATGGHDLDAFVQYSDNMGAEWSPRIRVNDDGGTNSQFLPWLDVNQVTGAVGVVWYDARNDPANRQVEVFFGFTNDGFGSLSNILVSDNPSDQSGFYGVNFMEYIGLALFDCVAWPVWSDNSQVSNGLDYFTDELSLTCNGD